MSSVLYRQCNPYKLHQTTEDITCWGPVSSLATSFMAAAAQNNFIAYFSAVFIFITLGSFHCYASVVLPSAKKTRRQNLSYTHIRTHTHTHTQSCREGGFWQPSMHHPLEPPKTLLPPATPTSLSFHLRLIHFRVVVWLRVCFSLN